MQAVVLNGDFANAIAFEVAITMQGEQGSADIAAACEFKYDFERVLVEYSTEQIFNCDETGLQYRLLP